MPVHFSIRESRSDKLYGKLIPALAHTAVSSLVLHQEERLTQNLENAAVAGNYLNAPTIYAAHWAGSVDPVTAANQLAFLDYRLLGRFGVEIIEGADASALGHEVAWRRTNEYLMLLKRLWSNEKPFDQECEFYRVQQGFVGSKGPQGAHVPIRMTGLTGTALQVCARHATTFEIAFAPLDETSALIQQVRDAASRYGRTRAISFALRLPQAAPSSALQASRSAQVDTLADLLRPYVELGITEFVFDGSEAAGALLARIEELTLSLESRQSESAVPRQPLPLGRSLRSVN